MIRQRLLKGTLSNCVGKVTTVGTWFLLTPFVLSRLGPEAYALWVVVSAIASYGFLLEHGTGGAVIKYVAEHVARGERAAARAVVASATRLYLGLALLALAATALLAPQLPSAFNIDPAQHDTATLIIFLTGVNVAVAIAFMPAPAVFKGLQRYDLHNGILVVNSLVEALAVVVVLIAGWGLPGMMAALIVVSLLTGLASIVLLARVSPDLRVTLRGADAASFKRIASFSSSLFAIQIGGRLQNRADEFVIAAFHSLAGVTPYALARKLAELSEIAAVQFIRVLMPLASELDAADQQGTLRRLYIISSRVALAISVPIAVVVIVLAPAILTLWVGAEYAAHAHLVAVLAVAPLVVTSQWPAVEVLQGMARHRVVAVTWIGAGIANVLLSIVLLRYLGLLGVALGTLIPATVAALCVVMPFANRTLGVPASTLLRKVWAPVCIPGGLAGAVLWGLDRYFAASSLPVLLGCLAITGVIYVTTYLCMPAASAERRLARDVVGGIGRPGRRVGGLRRFPEGAVP